MGGDQAGRQVLALHSPGAGVRDTPSALPGSRRGSSEPAGGAVAAARFPGRRGPEVRRSLPARSSGVEGGPAGGARGLDLQKPGRARCLRSAHSRRLGLGGRCGRPAAPGAAAMPFLHGFRRIIFEYQPLVDAILGSLGIQDPERQEPLDG